MADFDWRSTLSAVAPGLAAAFGGPLAGAAVKVIADKVLGRPNASQAEVEDMLASGGLTPDAIVALKSAELEFQTEMARVQVEMEKAYIADTASARQQTVDLAKENSGIAWGAPVISLVITMGFFGAVYLLFFIERNWDERTANLLNVLFGALTVTFTQVANYWLGSSAGSKRAGDAVRKIAEQKESR